MMTLHRIIPVLLLKNGGLVKTMKFKDPKYVGDPLNAVKIFNEKEVDELIFLDITVTAEKKKIQLILLEKIAGECFMPLCYGGGIKTVEDIQTVLKTGVEKVSINTAAVENPGFIREAAMKFGTSTIVISLDVMRNLWGKYEIWTYGGKKNTHIDLFRFAQEIENMGAGELLLTAIDRDGTRTGYDLELISKITQALKIPVIASGGAGTYDDFGLAIHKGGASAVAGGSIFVLHGKHRAVLISYPSSTDLEKIFS